MYGDGGGWVDPSNCLVSTQLQFWLLGLMLGCDKSQRYKRGEHMDRLTHRLTNAWSDKQTDRQSEGQMNVLTDKHMDRRTHTQIHRGTDSRSDYLSFYYYLSFWYALKISNFFKEKFPIFSICLSSYFLDLAL